MSVHLLIHVSDKRLVINLEYQSKLCLDSTKLNLSGDSCFSSGLSNPISLKSSRPSAHYDDWSALFAPVLDVGRVTGADAHLALGTRKVTLVFMSVDLLNYD